MKTKSTHNLTQPTHKLSKSMQHTWNYRIIKSKVGYEVHEVHYENSKPKWWTIEEVSPYGETLKELKEDFEHYKLAFEKPVLIVKGTKLCLLKTSSKSN